MFNSIIKILGNISPEEFVICTAASVVFGFIIAFAHMFRNQYTRGFATSLVVLPLMVQVIIMLVNGSIGTGIAVMGAFSLIRFRSATGNAREISSIFVATAAGLANAMGYIWVGAAVVLVAELLIIVLNLISFGAGPQNERNLKIIIPEDLDFEGVFDDIFIKYTDRCELIKCKTTNMGSLYELTYLIRMKKGVGDKQLIDEIRCRNGNLTIICGRPTFSKDDL